MKRSNLKIVKINKTKKLFNYEKKVLIKELLLDLKIGYFDFEKEKKQKVKFSLEIDYVDKKPSSDKDIKSIVNYAKVVRLIKKLVKKKNYNFEKEKKQKVKFSLEVDYKDKKPTSDKDIKSIVNYDKIVKLITKLVKNRHYNFLETLAEDVFDELFKDQRIDKIVLQIEKLEIMRDCSSVGIQISKKRSHD